MLAITMRNVWLIVLSGVVLAGCSQESPQAKAKVDQGQASVETTAHEPSAPVTPHVLPESKPVQEKDVGARLAIEAVVPRAIANETEAAECWAAAMKLKATVEDVTNQPANVSTTTLSDCVLQQDTNSSNYTKFYPDGLRLRVSGGYANLFVPTVKTAVTHVKFDPVVLTIMCTTRDGTRKAMVGMIRIPADKPFKRSGNWSSISNADELEAFVLAIQKDRAE